MQWTTDGRRRCRKNAVLLCVRGSTTGRLNRADRPYVIGRGVAAVESDSAVDQSFLFYALTFQLAALLERTTGSVFPNLSRDDIESLPIPWPGERVRGGIAEVLGALDDKIEANRRQIRLLDELIAATWLEAFVRSDARAWPKQEFGQVVKVLGGSTPSTKVGEYWDGNIAWATPKDLARGESPPLLRTRRQITSLGLSQISSGVLPCGTVLLSSRAPIGYLAIAEIPVAVNQGLIAIPPKGRLPGLYLWQWLLHHLDEVEARANGTTFLEISKANFRTLPVQVPPEGVTKEWLEVAEPSYRLLVSRECEIGQLVALRDALLPGLLSGQLRVRKAEGLVGETL
ncbi:MAG: restriction endonuclease subunit S [Acidimicrobiales bacterium]